MDNLGYALIAGGAAIACSVIYGAVKRGMARNPNTLPIEHVTKHDDRAAKSALRTLAKYLASHGVDSDSELAEAWREMARIVHTSELQWPDEMRKLPPQ